MEVPKMPRVCVFDVNETLLDLSALDPHFERAFGDASARKTWFLQVLQSALVATVTDAYSEFGAVGAAALQMTAERLNVELSEEDRRKILGGMRELPPHPEVPESLDRLRDSGLRLAALTNSTQQVAEAQLENAGIADRFERILSADSVKRLKPSPAPYRFAAKSLGVEASGVRLVAAHSWDVAGAMRVGCAAAFVARPGMVLDPLAESPDVTGADLREVAEKILDVENGRGT
jgi:2-haloacid dehalogenase